MKKSSIIYSIMIFFIILFSTACSAMLSDESDSENSSGISISELGLANGNDEYSLDDNLRAVNTSYGYAYLGGILLNKTKQIVSPSYLANSTETDLQPIAIIYTDPDNDKKILALGIDSFSKTTSPKTIGTNNEEWYSMSKKKNIFPDTFYESRITVRYNNDGSFKALSCADQINYRGTNKEEDHFPYLLKKYTYDQNSVLYYAKNYNIELSTKYGVSSSNFNNWYMPNIENTLLLLQNRESIQKSIKAVKYYYETICKINTDLTTEKDAWIDKSYIVTCCTEAYNYILKRTGYVPKDCYEIGSWALTEENLNYNNFSTQKISYNYSIKYMKRDGDEYKCSLSCIHPTETNCSTIAILKLD